ncbi:glucosamine-6-phosphate deaminase [soil metagenome]
MNLSTYSEKRFEKLPTTIFSDAKSGSLSVAKYIADLIKKKAKENKLAILGLATGSTPTQVYNEMVRMHQEEGLSFQNVVTFNLDEYFPMQPDSLQSYVRFMNEYLFDHVDIKKENIHIPDGTIPIEEVPKFCMQYEQKIKEFGGLDMQLLGIGRTGHIGFNEPGSLANSRTRLITLDKITRTDAASDFFIEENVPRRAITMGVGTILEAKLIYLLAWGEGKSKVIKRTVEGEITDSVPATFLQQHNNVEVILDDASAAELTRIKTPWLVGPCDWNAKLTRQAVVWLCQKLKKPILKLTDEDYNENGMSDLVTDSGPAYKINIRIFNELQHTITGWPGGKPGADDSQRPERALPFPKKVLVFSPHPDDDVISMGGTLIRLVDQGHEVHVAYQTSGNIAVFDDDAVRFVDFALDFQRKIGRDEKEAQQIYTEVTDFLENKKPGQVDDPLIQSIKGLIRRGEAKAACRYCEIPDENVHFLDMPFYETGRVRKQPLGEEDIKIVMDIIEKVKPHQIYAAGDLSDPHGTHRVCLSAIFQAVERLKDNKWMKDCYLWLYRGAWQEWNIDQIEMAVPISPEELIRKRRAIFKHQSQKDRPLFPGHDSREFWQRAEDRNMDTAQLYDALGLAEYEAIEAFVRWHF